MKPSQRAATQNFRFRSARGRGTNAPVLDGSGMIGVFDSGHGGLTVLRALTRHLPDRTFVYFGDHAHAP
jgi:hypothetical protein